MKTRTLHHLFESPRGIDALIAKINSNTRIREDTKQEKTGSQGKSRDCRRTWSNRAEKAHISRSHVIVYMGHKGRQQTDLYQTRAITRAELDEDCKKLQTFIDNERAATQPKLLSHYALATSREVLRWLDVETQSPDGAAWRFAAPGGRWTSVPASSSWSGNLVQR